MDSFFRLPSTLAILLDQPACDWDEFAKLTEANVAVRQLEPLHELKPEKNSEVLYGLRKAMGWEEVPSPTMIGYGRKGFWPSLRRH
jgi:hypothetical protein